MKILKPTSTEYPNHLYFSRYINTVLGDDAMSSLRNQSKQLLLVYSNLSVEMQNYRYAPEKWTLKELLGHIIDAERVFSYRAMCIARGEHQSLPGFEEDEYMTHANFSTRSLNSLLKEYKGLRQANLALFGSLSEQMLNQIGTANGNSVSARALIWILAGHEQHHLHIINERYLS